jgi:NAD(P)-dependent dehydrogenase (short-subunit alcohol dehydrogenase family)
MSKSAAVSFADGLRREMKKWAITVHTIEPTLYKYVTLSLIANKKTAK